MFLDKMFKYFACVRLLYHVLKVMEEQVTGKFLNSKTVDSSQEIIPVTNSLGPTKKLVNLQPAGQGGCSPPNKSFGGHSSPHFSAQNIAKHYVKLVWK